MTSRQFTRLAESFLTSAEHFGFADSIRDLVELIQEYGEKADAQEDAGDPCYWTHVNSQQCVCEGLHRIYKVEYKKLGISGINAAVRKVYEDARVTKWTPVFPTSLGR